MKRLVFLIFLFFTHLHANQNTYSLNRHSFVVLKGFPSIKFLLFVPASYEVSKKINQFAIQELEKFGKVIVKSIDLQSLMEEMNDANSFLKSPSLIYRIENEEKGFNAIAVLEFQAAVSIEKTKEYCHAILWSSQCDIQTDINHDLENGVIESLKFLLKEFNQDFQEANQSHQIKPIFYLPE